MTSLDHAALGTFKAIRAYVLRLTDSLSADHLMHVPPGASNNVLWNLGHLAVTQQLLHYRLSGLPLSIPEEALPLFRKGTSPADWPKTPDVEAVRTWLAEGPERLAEDYTAGRFETYQTYPTSTGITLDSIDTAIQFNTFHEGLHVTAIKSLLAAS